MSRTTSPGPPLDASGVFAWRILEFLSNKLPSAREGLGNQRLERARRLASENSAMISTRDMEIARDKFAHTTDIRQGLGSRRGLSKLLQAQEYCKSAKDALRFVETVSGRAMDDMLMHRAAGYSPVQIRMDTSGTRVDPRLCAEMKPTVVTLVENLYQFDTSQARESICSNTKRAQILLRDMNFVYPEAWNGGKRHNPYRHPIIQKTINMTWFRNKDDVGVVHHEHFSPMPISIIALTLTVIERCIDEWSDGVRKDSSWDEEKLQAVYASHVSSLFDFKAHSPTSSDVLYQLQCDLLKDAREHAGVSHFSTTEPGRFPPGALDVVRQGYHEPTSPDLPAYGEIPEIVIATL